MWNGEDLFKAVLLGSGGSSGGGSSGGGGGGGSAAVSPKEVNFYDYDGTLRYAYTVAEAQALSELPAGPEHPGLVFQGWNWSLEGVKALTRAMNIGAMYTTDDGATRLYITLQEGRTSPMLGVGVNGTVTVDWGDGTEPDVLTGTNVGTTQWTPNHAYAAPGDYVIRLTVDGEMCITGTTAEKVGCNLMAYSENDFRNLHYRKAINRIEVGDNVTQVVLYLLDGLRAVTLPLHLRTLVTSKGCNSLGFLCVPLEDNGYTSSGYESKSLKGICLPESFSQLSPSVFQSCEALQNITLRDDTTGGDMSAFNKCYMLRNLSPISDVISSVGTMMFQYCYNLTSIIFSGSVTTISSQAFYACYGMAYYDFTACSAVPTLSNTNAFYGIPDDCEIRVPAALYDEWIAATNWAAYASQIVAY